MAMSGAWQTLALSVVEACEANMAFGPKSNILDEERHRSLHQEKDAS